MTKNELNGKLATLVHWASQDWRRAVSLGEDLERIYLEFDKARQPVADAAWFLFNGGRAMQEDLRHSSADRILFNSGAYGATLGSLIDQGFLVSKYAVVDVRNAMYPHRERNADAAQFLWRVNTNPVDDRKSSLINCPPSTIRLAARYRQEELASVVADNAWIAFDEGGFEADLKCAPPKRIHDLAVMAKAKQVARDLVGTMDIEGYGANGERITVRGIVVRRSDSGSLGALSERASKQYGIAGASSVSVGWLP